MSFVLDRPGLDELIAALASDGYQVFGPAVVDAAIRYQPIGDVGDLPEGVRDIQGPGTYRLESRSDDALFGYTVGPSSLADLFFPPRRPVWTATRDNGTITFTPVAPENRPIAVVGARACEVAAAEIQDVVLTGGAYVDADYASRRDQSFIVTVDCTEPGDSCFCGSMDTGPAARHGYDLGLTETRVDDAWVYVGRVGSEAGERMIGRITHRGAYPPEVSRASSMISTATASMGRQLSIAGVAEFLAANPTHPNWESIAERCLACGNCTQACPTCFCVSTVDTASLDGSMSLRESRWDSCFSLDFSYMGGRPHRSSVGARYRQWLTHKMSGWVDQFGMLGCVGCGRCITWCPVGIDLTVEIPEMMNSTAAGAGEGAANA